MLQKYFIKQRPVLLETCFKNGGTNGCQRAHKFAAHRTPVGEQRSSAQQGVSAERWIGGCAQENSRLDSVENFKINYCCQNWSA